MKRRSFFFFLVLMSAFPFCVFSQQGSAGALRDYVGLINQSYHPDIVSYFEKTKAELESKGETGAAKAIDIFLGGSTGSGFVYSDARGNLYVITNNHVVAQAYSLSITFERQDGSKKRFDNLKIVAADEENDIALLSFAPGDKPVARGLSFLTRPVEEGEDVYSAGFPGLGITPLWQFGRGMVSNAAARFPKSFDDETLIGPFVQHTAQIDPGNSGGPLLVAQRNAPSGYAVAGINTLSAVRRQAANYAIPVRTAQAFVNGALNQRPDNYRAALDERVAEFVEGLGVNKAVYPHIAGYLSSVCVGENAEYSMTAMFEKGNTSVRQAFINKCEEGVVGAMGYAVAWTIENSIRGQGVIKAAIKEITGAEEAYTIVFTINNKEHSSTWIREYGNWKIRSFGAVAAGDKKLIKEKRQVRQNSSDIRDDSDFHIEAGYAYLFDKAPAALYAALEGFGSFGAKVYYAGSDFYSIGGFGGFRGSFTKGNFGFNPYIRIGIDLVHDKDYDDFKTKRDNSMDFYISPTFSSSFDVPIVVMAQAGIKITTSHVPGLFGGIAFQYNLFDMRDDDYESDWKMALCITAGYAF